MLNGENYRLAQFRREPGFFLLWVFETGSVGGQTHLEFMEPSSVPI